MEETAEPWIPRHQIDDLMDDRPRLGGAKADAEAVAKRENLFDDIREIAAAIIICGYIDARQDDFPMAAADQFGSLAQKIMQISGTGGAARVRDDAVRAEEITALLDLEVRPRPFVIKRNARAEKVLTGVARRGKQRFLLTYQLVAKQLAKRGGLRVRHDQIDFRILFRICDRRLAAHQYDKRVRQPFSGGADGLPRFLRGDARHGAAVDDDDVRRLAPWHGLVAVGGQIARDGG